jgi:ABC-2 type transport system permease protein
MFFLIKYLVRWFRRRQATTNAKGPDSSGSSRSAAPSTRTVAPAASSGPPAASRGPIALLLHEAAYDLRVSRRNPRARFMMFFFPIVLLVVFNGAFGHGTTTLDGVTVKLSRFYVPGILAMSIVVASYANIVVSIATLRETGVLKRRRATPVPAWILVAGQALATVATVAVMSTALLLIAKFAYGIGYAPGALAAIACTAMLGAIALACVGYAVSGLIGSPDAAQPVVQATMLPLWFISGVFIPNANLSSGLRHLGDLFPVAHLANVFHLASVHSSFSASISAGDVLALAAWALAAVAFAAWRFSWLPSTASA